VNFEDDDDKFSRNDVKNNKQHSKIIAATSNSAMSSTSYQWMQINSVRRNLLTRDITLLKSLYSNEIEVEKCSKLICRRSKWLIIVG